MQSVVLFCNSQREAQDIGEGLLTQTGTPFDFSPLFKQFVFSLKVVCVSPDEQQQQQQHRWWKRAPVVSEVLHFGTSSHEVEAPHRPQLFLQVAQSLFVLKQNNQEW